jgi:hypothetical protein
VSRIVRAVSCQNLLDKLRVRGVGNERQGVAAVLHMLKWKADSHSHHKHSFSQGQPLHASPPRDPRLPLLNT